MASCTSLHVAMLVSQIVQENPQVINCGNNTLESGEEFDENSNLSRRRVPDLVSRMHTGNLGKMIQNAARHFMASIVMCINGNATVMTTASSASVHVAMLDSNQLREFLVLLARVLLND